MATATVSTASHDTPAIIVMRIPSTRHVVNKMAVMAGVPVTDSNACARDQAKRRLRRKKALATYNLVRAVICLAAEKLQVPPRRLSFTNVYTLVETFSSEILAAPTAAAQQACWQRIVSFATQYLLPVRSKLRSFPRAVWPKIEKRYPANTAP